MKKIWAVALLALACLTFTAASSAEEQEWQLFTPEGTYLTAVGEEPEIGDIYIAGDNRQYEVTQVTQGRRKQSIPACLSCRMFPGWIWHRRCR